ncbi:LAME_0A02740g1_1 [Lachancea meyersii CBS 8951]|uniref:LAME_0A02740g1_1 n=1 Tax=Lachancea meyersii CBS 8951 TaxID=1266667 RepID=A0A1G4INC1_9SACH|nr:LAME_0A02740g1_1 [Lachancea meyersii CBS 8951]
MTSSHWNPQDVLVTFQSLSGEQISLDCQQMQTVVNRRITQGVLFGTRIGAAVITIVILLMVSKNRKTPIFISNQISLLLVVLQSALYLGYLFSPFASIGFTVALMPDAIPTSNLHLFAATNIFQVLLAAAIEASLILQVRIIFKSDTLKTAGRVLVAIASALALATVIIFLVSAIKSISAIYGSIDGLPDTVFFNIGVILQSTSINFMTVLLAVKLVLAVRSRRFLGLKQFDSFHILAIMSFQTLIFPSILFILAYALPESQGTSSLNSIAVLLVTLSLPLSSMWATSANNGYRPSSLNTSFSPSIYDGSPGKADDRSLYSQSGRSSGFQQSNCQANELFPMARTGDLHHGYNYNMGDLEKANCHSLAVSLHTAGGSSLSSDQNQNGQQRRLEQLERVVESGAYTPNTLDDEDARNFWSGTKA